MATPPWDAINLVPTPLLRSFAYDEFIHPSGTRRLTTDPDGLNVVDGTIKESELFIDAKQLFKILSSIGFA